MYKITNLLSSSTHFAGFVETAIEPFVTMILFLSMLVTLMLPIFAIPYIFIKMGSVAGKVQAKINSTGRSARKIGTRAAKTGVKNSAYGQAYQQRKGVRQQIRADRGRAVLTNNKGLVGMGAEGRAYMDRLEKGEQKKRMNEHMTALRDKSGEDLYNIFNDRTQGVDRREAAAQLFAAKGDDGALLAAHENYGRTETRNGVTSPVGAGDQEGRDIFTRVKADNYTTIKKETPTVIGKEPNKLSQSELLGMGSTAFKKAMADPSNDAARATFAAAYANPLNQNAIKGHHTDAMGDPTLRIPSVPSPAAPAPPPAAPLPPGADGGFTGETRESGLWTPNSKDK